MNEYGSQGQQYGNQPNVQASNPTYQQWTGQEPQQSQGYGGDQGSLQSQQNQHQQQQEMEEKLLEAWDHANQTQAAESALLVAEITGSGQAYIDYIDASSGANINAELSQAEIESGYATDSAELQADYYNQQGQVSEDYIGSIGESNIDYLEDKTAFDVQSAQQRGQNLLNTLTQRGQAIIADIQAKGTIALDSFVRENMYFLDQTREITGPNSRPGYGGVRKYGVKPREDQVKAMPGFKTIQDQSAQAEANARRLNEIDLTSAQAQMDLDMLNAQRYGDIAIQQARERMEAELARNQGQTDINAQNALDKGDLTAQKIEDSAMVEAERQRANAEAKKQQVKTETELKVDTAEGRAALEQAETDRNFSQALEGQTAAGGRGNFGNDKGIGNDGGSQQQKQAAVPGQQQDQYGNYMDKFADGGVTAVSAAAEWKQRMELARKAHLKRRNY